MKWCPTGSLRLEDKNGREVPLSVLEPAACSGCGECVVTCPHEAIKISWSGAPQSVQEKTVEFAWAVAKEKPGKIGAINFLMDISPDCDCLSRSDASVVADVGILGSDDIVAIDRASIDLINRQPSLPGTAIAEGNLDDSDKFGALHGVDWTPQFKYAEEIGLGSADYELRDI